VVLIPDQKNAFSFMENIVDFGNAEHIISNICNGIDRIDVEYFYSFFIYRIMETQREGGRMIPKSSTRQSRFIVK